MEKVYFDIFKSKFNGWIDGWIDATGDYYYELCTNKRSVRKIINYLNSMCDNAQIRKEVFDSIFEDVGFTYNININIIGDEESIDKIIESECESEIES